MKVPKISSSKVQAQASETKRLEKYALQNSFITKSTKAIHSLLKSFSSKDISELTGAEPSQLNKDTLEMDGLLAYLCELLYLKHEGKNVDAQIAEVVKELKAIAAKYPGSLGEVITSALNAAYGGYSAFSEWLGKEGYLLAEQLLTILKDFGNLNLKSDPKLLIDLVLFMAFCTKKYPTLSELASFFSFIGNNGSMAFLFAKFIALYFYNKDKGDWGKVYQDFQMFIDGISLYLGNNTPPGLEKFINDLKTDFKAMFPGGNAKSGKLPYGWNFKLAYGDLLRALNQWIQSLSS